MDRGLVNVFFVNYFMKNIYISLILLLISVQINAQGTQIGNLSINEYFTESFTEIGNTQTLCVDVHQGNAVAVSIYPRKFVPAFPQHKCGNMWVFNSDLNWGAPFVWQTNIEGNLYPYELKNINNSSIIVGYFTDSIQVQNTKYYALDSTRASSFILSLNLQTGELNWLTVIQDSIYNSVATSFTVISPENILVSALHHDIESAIYKININTGSIISTKIFPNVRTISSIAKLNENVYVAGTAGDFANIDTFTVHTNLNTGYANYMFKADTNLNLKSLVCEPYITFDFTSHLSPRQNDILWSFFKQNNSQGLVQSFNLYRDIDTLVRRLSFSTNFNFSEYDNRLVIPTDMFGFLLFKKDGLDYNLYQLNFGGMPYFERITKNTNVELYDVTTDFLESFISGSFSSDTLFLLQNTLVNSSFNENKSCQFMSFFHEIYGSVNNEKQIVIKTFPNPVEEELNIASDDVQYVSILNTTGQLMNTYYSTNKINIHQLPSGIYLMKGYTSDKYFSVKFIKK